MKLLLGTAEWSDGDGAQLAADLLLLLLLHVAVSCTHEGSGTSVTDLRTSGLLQLISNYSCLLLLLLPGEEAAARSLLQ